MTHYTVDLAFAGQPDSNCDYTGNPDVMNPHVVPKKPEFTGNRIDWKSAESGRIWGALGYVSDRIYDPENHELWLGIDEREYEHDECGDGAFYRVVPREGRQ